MRAESVDGTATPSRLCLEQRDLLYYHKKWGFAEVATALSVESAGYDGNSHSDRLPKVWKTGQSPAGRAGQESPLQVLSSGLRRQHRRGKGAGKARQASRRQRRCQVFRRQRDKQAGQVASGRRR